MLEIIKIEYTTDIGERDAVFGVTDTLTDLLMKEGYKLSAFFDVDEEVPEDVRLYTFVGEIRFVLQDDSTSPTLKIVQQKPNQVVVALTANSSRTFSQLYLALKDVVVPLCETLSGGDIPHPCACTVVDFGLENIKSNVDVAEQIEKNSLLDMLNFNPADFFKKGVGTLKKATRRSK